MKVRRVENGDVPFGRGLAGYASGGEASLQLCWMRLSQWRGEGEDETVGVPWQSIRGYGMTTTAAAYIRATIVDTEGVSALSQFSIDFNRATRAYTANARVTTVDGFAGLVAGAFP